MLQPKILDSIIKNFNKSPSIRGGIKSCFFVLYAVVLTLNGILNNTSKFSPDSWAYYELSKTIFQGEFYKFNTYRSYFSETHSAAFPFGYPILLASVQYLFGYTPLTAVVINVFAGLLTWLMILKLTEKIKLSALTCVAIAISLVFFTPYLEEVFAGRSIPVAILLFITSIYSIFFGRFILCGVFLGLSALIRFDHLVYAFIFQFLAFFIFKRQIKKPLLIGFGFFVGIMPWIIYSQIYFGKLWVSDNSWVALSALPAFVVDYPASATTTAFENPMLWLDRIAENINRFLPVIFESSVKFPLVLFLLFVCVLFFHDVRKNKKNIYSFISIIAIGASFSPFLLTGYFDVRYFALPLLVLSGLLAFSIEISPLNSVKIRNYYCMIAVAILLNLLIGGVYLAKIFLAGVKNYGNPDPDIELLMQLEKCHSTRPDVTLIFDGNTTFAARYGATTGNRAAFLPSNFAILSDKDKAAYFDQMNPSLLIDRNLKVDQCPF